MEKNKKIIQRRFDAIDKKFDKIRNRNRKIGSVLHYTNVVLILVSVYFDVLNGDVSVIVWKALVIFWIMLYRVMNKQADEYFDKFMGSYETIALLEIDNLDLLLKNIHLRSQLDRITNRRKHKVSKVVVAKKATKRARKNK